MNDGQLAEAPSAPRTQNDPPHELRVEWYGGHLRRGVIDGDDENGYVDTAKGNVVERPLALTQWSPESVQDRIVPPVVMPAPKLALERFNALQQWEGVVIEVTESSFTARLKDSTHKTPAEEAEFELEDVPASDLPLVLEGAVFYWSIGYYDTAGGQRLRSSSFRFRRLPVWSDRELGEAKDRAQATAELLDWN